MDVDPVELIETAKMGRKRLMVSFLNCDSYS
jgi:hypothetical protein